MALGFNSNLLNSSYGSMSNWGGMSPVDYSFGSGSAGLGLQIPGVGGVSPITGNTADSSGGFWNSMTGTKDQPGWGGMALGGAQALGNLFMGMQQYGLAKKTFAENKRQFDLNYGAQRDTTNTALEDRQRARVASNPGAYQGVDAYMAQNGIK